MTVQEPSNPEEHITPSSPARLPQVTEILLFTFSFTRHHAETLYGFAAYLLFPIILNLAVQNVTGLLGDILSGISAALLFGTLLWIHATIMILVSMTVIHPKKKPDPRSVGNFAFSTLRSLTLTSIVSGVIQLAGLFLLVVPGIVASILFLFAPQEVVLHGAGPFSALANSRKKVTAFFVPVTLRALSLIGLAILGYGIAGVGITEVASVITGIPGTSLFVATPAWLDAIYSVLQIGIFPPLIVGLTTLYLAVDTTFPRS